MSSLAPRLPSSISRAQLSHRVLLRDFHQSSRRIYSSLNYKASCHPRILNSWRHHHRHPTTTQQQWRRTFASSTTTDDGKGGHAAFEEQLKELQEERNNIFGDDDDPIFIANDTKHADYELQLRELQDERNQVFGIQEEVDDDYTDINVTESSFEEDSDLEGEQWYQLKVERDEVYGFSHKEHTAWGNLESGTDKLPASLMEEIEQARADAQAAEDAQGSTTPATTNNTFATNENVFPAHGLTHLSDDGKSINMVDVGQKAVTQRMARAQTKVILPPEVVEALQLSQGNEIIGPKGPIFATAKCAGIMAAKKTSDLIPLCHPLPLDKVQVDIHLQSSNVVLISCECRVTHKTGVEMEALTGASVAALTVYDMLKAISHNIRIEETVLVSKSGGKRTVGGPSA